MIGIMRFKLVFQQVNLRALHAVPRMLRYRAGGVLGKFNAAPAVGNCGCRVSTQPGA